MKALVILNDAPYGSERTYNGLRLANSLVKQTGIDLKVCMAPHQHEREEVARLRREVEDLHGVVQGFMRWRKPTAPS